VRVIITAPWGERLGGAEAMLQGILEGASGGELELEPVFFSDGPWPEELRRTGLRVEVIEAGRLRQPHRWLRTVRRLARLFSERDPDLIIDWSAKTHVYGAPAAVLAGKRKRVVWWQHAIPSRNLQDMLATLMPAAAVFVCSAAARRAQERLFPRRRMITVAAGSPIPAEGVQPAALELPADVPVVGLVGRLQPGKNQDKLLRAQRILHDRGYRIHTLIVGGDSYGLSPRYAASLQPLAEELGIADAVTMTGEVPDAAPYIKLMDVLASAADGESFGIVILEGMAQGVAVMAVDSGGPAEFVDDGRTGVLAGSSRPEALADALQRLLDSPERRAQLARAGRQRYLEDFTTAAMRERVFARLRQLIQEAEASR
jgi:glycosyltransferase involved in cell wall biosynthesis